MRVPKRLCANNSLEHDNVQADLIALERGDFSVHPAVKQKP